MNKAFPDSEAVAVSGGTVRPPRTASPMLRVWREIERWIVIVHRWIGIGVCLLSVVWCLSGIALIYVVQPHLTEQEYHAGLQPIAWAQVHVDPTAAMKAAGLKRFPKDMVLEMSGPNPVYQMTDWKGAPFAVSAVDGKRITAVDAAGALAIARGYAHTDKPTYMKPVVSDRWTFRNTYDKLRPFHLIALNDADGRQLYISARTGKVSFDTGRGDRGWSWLARVPHLFEGPWMRPNDTAYRQLMLWTTALATVLSISGLYLGIVRLSLVKRYAGGKVTPFHGWMEWHHIMGLIGGVTLIAWVATAFVYMKPNHLYEATAPNVAAMQRYGGHKGADFPLSPPDLAKLAPPAAGSAGLTWIGGKAVAFFVDPAGRYTTYDGGSGAPAPLSDARLLQAARLMLPGAAVVGTEHRTTPDRYWHSFKGDFRKVPMFRVKFGDRDATWLHLDPDTGELMGSKQASDRTYFLFFNEIHKFDFYAFKEPGRQIVVWFLMLMGTGISVTGAWIGWKHLTKPKPGQRGAAA